MDLAVFGGRVLLAVVFTIAGIAKLADRTGSRKAVEDFGLPASLGTPLALVLPCVELVIAAALLTSLAHWGALAALVLLVLFSTAIAVSLARGKQPDCHCFGQLHSTPVGSLTLVRNGALAAVAGFVAWQGWTVSAPSATTFLSRLSTAQAAGIAAGAVTLGLLSLQAWFILHLLRQHGRLLVRMDALEATALRGGSAGMDPHSAGEAAGLPVGSQAPEFALPGLHGEVLTLAALRSPGRPVMLLFTAPGCGPCESLMPDVGQWQRDDGNALSIALISAGPPEAVAAIAGEHGLRNVLRQDAWEVADSYQYLGTPSAVIVDSEGRIATPLVAGPDAIRSLFSHSQGGRPIPVALGRGNGNGHHSHHELPTSALGIGEAAPRLQLLDLDGKTRDLDEFFAEETLLMFWNPGCGFCERMLGDLKAWEDQPPAGARKLVVISTGSVETNRAMGLRSPVLLDQRSEAMHAFGANGTPMAVLVDAEGRIASGLAVGGAAVLRLANEERDLSRSDVQSGGAPRRGSAGNRRGRP